ncbi:MAG TPA: helix-hairpin-helix domain-containing protein [Vicinamibacterales bacterium]|nr:helix-hairpin-helix domain-containing protein [Vicinamibacterales bacterium]
MTNERRGFRWALGASAMTLMAACFVSASTSAAVRQSGSDDANDPATQAFKRVCSNCHTPDRIISGRRDRDQWNEVIDKMIQNGAKGSDDDFDLVLEYLERHYGRVNVNHDVADDLSLVLSIPDDQAKAIVTYRQQHGPFADFDALEKVPGIDTAALEQVRDAVAF